MWSISDLKKKLAEVRKNVLIGTLDNDSPISVLRGNRYVLEDMLELIEKPIYEEFYKQRINKLSIPYMIWPRPSRYQPSDGSYVRTTPEVVFPPPKDININMMPIKMGGYLYRELPDNCKHYVDFIYHHCMATYYKTGEYLKDRIAYLTIQEGLVPVGETQRRPGLHIERPGAIKCGGKWHEANSEEYGNIAWGLGCWGEDGLPEDGIYMASTVHNSCAIYDCVIDNPEEVTDNNGGLENIRHLLGEPKKLQANEMCWFTDRTPHESLPIEAPEDDPGATHVYRQFFRLVVGPISAWYSKQNTPNPRVEPDAPISDDDKFI